MFPAGVADVQARWVTLHNGVTLRVVEAGAAGHRTILLMHGWGASLYMWRDWLRPLAQAGWRVLAPDLPGHGLSDKPDDADLYRVESLAAVVRELLEIEGLDKVDVVAQSMAGTIALELASAPDSPVRRLVLVNPASFGRVRMQRLARMASPSLVNVVLPHLVVRWIVARAHRMVYGDPTRITRDDENEYWAPSQFPAFARAMRLLIHEFRWVRSPIPAMAKRLKTLSVRVLVVLGTRDRLVRDARPYAGALIAAGAPIELRIIEGGGHAVNEERPSQVIPLVLEFLEDAS